MADTFGSIGPAPIADTFVFDFTFEIGASGTIVAATWQCAVDPVSTVIDPDPASRILGPPTFTANKTSALIGNMVDGCAYVIEAQVTLDDSRVLAEASDLQCTSVQPVADPCAPLTPDQFRMFFPAFTDPGTYPDAMVQLWLNQCPIDCCIWGQMYQFGMGLWAAHEMTKFGPNGLASLPGQTGIGIVNNKSVDSVSIGYDTQMGADPEAGQYNMTLYGRQFWSLLKYLPIGPIQIGPGGNAGYSTPTSGAWIGPWPFPGPAQSGFSS